MATGRITARPQVFVRQSSGLIREFSLLDVIIINTVGVNAPFGIILTLAAVTSIWPQVDLTWLTVFGGIASAATVITYGFMSAAMPRSGGDYVFVGRSLWPWFGFATNWMMTFSLFVLFGIFAVSIATLAIGPSLTAFGYVISNSTVVNWANQVETDKTTIAVLAFLSVLTCIGIALMGDRWVRQAFRILTIVGAIGAVLALIILAMNDHAQFVSRMNSILSAHHLSTIQQMRAAAVKAGFHPMPFSMTTTLQALPYGFFLFVGLTYTTYLGGEIQRPQRSQPLGMAITLVVTGVYYILFAVLAYRAYSHSDVQAWAYLSSNKPSALAFPGGAPYGNFFVGALTTNGLISFLLGISFFAWTLMIMLFAVIMPARNLFAWSMDRIFPDVVSAVNRNGTPWVATSLVGLGALIMVYIAVFTSIISLFVNYTLIYAWTFLFAGIGAAAFPYSRPDLFNNAPEITRKRFLGVPWITIAGAAETIIFIWIIIASIKLPALSGPVGGTPLAIIFGMLIAGPIVFFISRAIRKSQGIDMDAAWATLPPD